MSGWPALGGVDITDDNRTEVRAEIDDLVAEQGDLALQLRALTASEIDTPQVADAAPAVERQNVRGEHAELVKQPQLSTYVRAAMAGQALAANTPKPNSWTLTRVTPRAEGG